jgi:hypothetical protein
MNPAAGAALAILFCLWTLGFLLTLRDVQPGILRGLLLFLIWPYVWRVISRAE